jgi:predicted esterase
MSITEHHIQTTKTARYYSAGSFEGEVRELWFVIHGYAQRAENFIKDFLPILQEGVLIIAPEALSRFYTKGFSGNVAASWMTREDRKYEIEDYIRYLDNLYSEIMVMLKKPPRKIIVFGFSQGCPTVLRWQAEGNSPANEIVIWSGDVPRDLPFGKFKANSEKANKWLVYSPTDEFITPEIYKESQDLFMANNIEFSTFKFEGGHSIPDSALKELHTRF